MRNKLYRKRSISLLLALALLLSGITTDAGSVFSYAAESSSTEGSAENEEEKSGESGGSEEKEEKEEKKDEDSDSSEDSDKDHDSDKDRESGDKDDSGDNGDSGSSGSGENNSDSGSGEGSSGSQEGNGSGSDEGSTEASTEAPSESSEESPTETPTEESKEGSAEHEHVYEVYISNEDGTHYSVCSFEGCEMRLSENCIYDDNGKCVKCGYEKPAEEEEATEEAGDTESENEAEKEEKLKFQVLTFDNVRVEGNLPENTTLDVREIEKDEAWELLEEKDRDKEIVCAYDITLYHNGEVYQPDDSVKVFIEPPKDIEVEEIDSEELSIVHVIEDEKNETVDLEINDEGDFEFEADSFSPWVVVIDGENQDIDYVEAAPGKTFDQTVTINFNDASLVDRDNSTVKITLYGNVNGEKVKSGDTESTERIEIATVESEMTSYTDGTPASASVTYTFNDIPVYVIGKTGDVTDGGNGTYKMPDGFYGILIETVPGYTPDKGTGDNYAMLNPVPDQNDAVWTTSTITINNKIMELTNPSFEIEWQDNRNYAGMRPYSNGYDIASENRPGDNIELYYKSGSEYIRVEDDSPILSRQGTNHPGAESISFSTWLLTFDSLPKKTSDNSAEYDWYIKPSQGFLNDGTDRSPYYILSGLNGDGYLPVSESSMNKLTYTYSDGVTGTITWRLTDNSLVPVRPSNGEKFTSAGMKLYKKEGAGAPVLIDDYNIEWGETVGGDGWKKWTYSIKNLPLYSVSGDAINYYTVMENENNTFDTGSAKFKFSYDNGSFSAETDKCYAGHDIYATITDNADFNFKKSWLDGNDEESVERRRSAISNGITLYLWRYPVNKSVSEGAAVTKNAKQYTYKLTEADAGNASDHEIEFSLSKFSDTDTFPKYDEMGYEYVYYVTEVSDSALYSTVYWNSEESYNGNSAYKNVSNNGYLYNVRSAKIAPTLTKTWDVAAVTDYVSSVCSFTLQRKVNGVWTDVEDIVISGFTSGKKSITGTFKAADLYDYKGQRYEYRAIEKSVKAGSGDNAVFAGSGWTQDENKASATYDLKGYTYSSLSIYETRVEDGVESASIRVVDKLSGMKDLFITKSWGGDWKIGTDESKTGDIHLTVKRSIDGAGTADYAYVTMTAPEKGEPEKSGRGVMEVNCSDPLVQVSENNYNIGNNGTVWKSAAIKVPAYTDDGQQYIYTLVETGVDAQPGVLFSKEYDRTITGKTISLSIRNYIGTWTSKTRIDVDKYWKDDSDTSQRSDVRVEFGTYAEDGTFTPALSGNDANHPYVMDLTKEKDYSNYLWIDGADLMTAGEKAAFDAIAANTTLSDEEKRSKQQVLRDKAVSDHLSIRATLKNSSTGEYDRVIKNIVLNTEKNSVSQGTVDALVDTGRSFYRPGYRVNITRSNSGQYFTITNTRAASRSFTFKKNWEDSNNRLGLRGDFLRVALFRIENGAEKEIAYQDIPASGNNETIEFNKNGNNYPAYDEDGYPYEYSMREYICEGMYTPGEKLCNDAGEEQDTTYKKTEVLTSATRDTTKTGYVVEEEPPTYQYSGINGIHDLYKADTRSLLTTEGYEHTNIAAGERESVEFFCIWHDQAKNDERPDIHFTLYYDGGENGEIISYNGAYTEKWEDVESGNKFIQKAVFSGVPAADENGRVYSYYVAETLNNATIDYTVDHYTEPLFTDESTLTYNAGAVEKDTENHQLIVKEGLAKNEVSVDGRFLIKEESFAVSTIYDTINISGRKLWQSIPEGITADKLPLAHIYLFRESEYDKSNAVPEVSASASQNARMDTYSEKAVSMNTVGDGSASPQRLNSAKAMYIFGTYQADGITPETYVEFPKYDSMGALYTYKVREIIYNTFDHELPADIMLPYYSDNTTDLTNYYKLDKDKNKRSIKITKQWNVTELNGGQVAAAKATFRLYRKEMGSDGDNYKALNYAKDDNDSNDPASSKTAAGDFNISDSSLELVKEEIKWKPSKSVSQNIFTFEDLPIFAPSGHIYAYYVVEMTADMPGYKVALNGNNPSNNTDEGSGPADNNTKVEGEGYIGVAFANSGIDLAKSPEENLKQETFRNTYNTKGFLKLKFTKKWDTTTPGDSNGESQMLPDIADELTPGTTRSLSFNIYAEAQTQSGKDNRERVNFTEGRDYDIESPIVDHGDPKLWTYTVKFKNPVPFYSANGNLYTYYVKEVLNSPFVKENYSADKSRISGRADAAVSSSGEDDNYHRILTLTENLTNSLKGKITVNKQWDDYKDDYQLREGAVKFKVQRKLENSGSWTDYLDDLELKKGGSWKYVISKLPVTTNDHGSIGEYYQYRIVETSIVPNSGEPLTVNPPSANASQSARWTPNGTTTPDSGNYYDPVTARNYQVYDPADLTSIANSPNVKIVNQLDTSKAVLSLKVIKNWVGDTGYNLRPEQISVRIERSVSNDATWSYVATKTITQRDNQDASDPNKWVRVFSNLPKYYGSTEDTMYKYRAVETKVGTGTGSETVIDATLTGTGGAYSVSHDCNPNPIGESEFTTTITNTLRTRENPIVVKKVWNDEETTHTAVRAALYSKNYGGGTPLTSAVRLDISGNTAEFTDGSLSFSFTGLPEFNKNGNRIVYEVREEPVVTTTKTQYTSSTGSEPGPDAVASDDYPASNDSSGETFYVNIINTPLIHVTGSKEWVDENNAFNLRPAEIPLTLQRRSTRGWEDVSVTELEKTNKTHTGVTAGTGGEATVKITGNAWSDVSIYQLPLYALGNGDTTKQRYQYQYRLAESNAPTAFTREINGASTEPDPDEGYSYLSGNGFQKSTVTNRFIKRGTIHVKKVWNTERDGDKKDVTVTLYSRNAVTGEDNGTGALTKVAGTGSEKTITAATNWQCEFTDLPLYNKNGRVIVYYVSENTIEGYKTQYASSTGAAVAAGAAVSDEILRSSDTDGASDFYVNIINTPLIKVTGSKVWDDSDNAFGLRRDNVTLTLQRRTEGGNWTNVTHDDIRQTDPSVTPGTTSYNVTVKSSESWDPKSVEKLPLYALGNRDPKERYQYRFAELTVPNAYTLKADGTDGPAATDEGYIYTSENSVQTSTVTNKLLRRGSINVEKIWNSTIDGEKTPVTVSIYSRNAQSGTDTGTGALTKLNGITADVTLNGTGAAGWTTAYTDLPLKNKDGQEIVYYVSENTGTGYSTVYKVGGVETPVGDVKSTIGGGVTDIQIINTPYTQASVNKVWDDQNDKYKTRPANIYVKLQRSEDGGSTYGDVIWSEIPDNAEARLKIAGGNGSDKVILTLNNAGSWKHTLNTLPHYAAYAGSPVKYDYRFVETDVSGAAFIPFGYSLESNATTYTKTFNADTASVTGHVDYSDAAGYRTVITNHLITKSFTVEKKWDDWENSHGIRPDHITVCVSENTAVTGSNDSFNGRARISNSTNNVNPVKNGSIWTYSFTGLPKYAYGTDKEIVYLASEDVNEDLGGGFMLKDYYEAGYVSSGTDRTVITNRIMNNDGAVIIEKKLVSGNSTIEFPFTVMIKRTDGGEYPFAGRYCIYDSAEISSVATGDLRDDAFSTTSAYHREEATASNGIVMIPAGKTAVLTDINSRYSYTVTENPYSLGYSVSKVNHSVFNGTGITPEECTVDSTGNITGETTGTAIIYDSNKASYSGRAEGRIAGKNSTPGKVVFTNKHFDRCLKIENTTPENGGTKGGEVRAYNSQVVVNDPREVDKNALAYNEYESGYVREAVSVEFEPDTDNGYTYGDYLTVSWWDDGDDLDQDPTHYVRVSGYVRTDASGNEVPVSGNIVSVNYSGQEAPNYDTGNERVIVSSDDEFGRIWGELLREGPFDHITVLEGSVVLTLENEPNKMPPKALVQVYFKPPETPEDPNGGNSGGSAVDSGSSTSGKGDSGSKKKKKSGSGESDTGSASIVNGISNLLESPGSVSMNALSLNGIRNLIRTGDSAPLKALIILLIVLLLMFAGVLGLLNRKKKDGNKK